MTLIKMEMPREMPRQDFANETEREFTQLLDVWGIDWEYEPHFFYEDDPDRPAGDSPHGYRPDLWLPGLGVYVEIYANKTWSRNHKLVGHKRARIRWLSFHENEATYLVSRRSWPEDRDDFLRQVRRAMIASAFEHYDPIPPYRCH